MSENLKHAHFWALTAFADRMAMLAVRERSVARLRIGLQAVAMAGDCRDADLRDAMTPVMLLEDATWRIGMNQEREFTDAARLAEPYTAKLLEGAARRPKWLRLVDHIAMALGVGQWKTIVARDGFRYVPKKRYSKEETEELVNQARAAFDEPSSSSEKD
jgi:hypothetical protein